MTETTHLSLPNKIPFRLLGEYLQVIEGVPEGVLEFYPSIIDGAGHYEGILNTERSKGRKAWGIRFLTEERYVDEPFSTGVWELTSQTHLSIGSETVRKILSRDAGPCPECFGTGFKGGFQTACSRGCQS